MVSEILKLQEAYLTGKVSCRKFIEGKIEEIRASRNNSVNLILDEYALRLADRVDEKIRKGEKLNTLDGIPFGLKDVYMLQGVAATASSKFLQNYNAPYTATAVQKLIEAGGIPLVKENCDSFGHGNSNENSFFGPVFNALNEELVPGGSSGGSAVNVAKGYTLFSIGGDTGGSVRQPAGYNKIYGMKPTYGRISRYGLMAYASSTDCVGPFSKSLEDIRILLNIMSGKDTKDQVSVECDAIDSSVFDFNPSETKFRIGYYHNFINNDQLDSDIKEQFIKTIEKLKEAGNQIQPLDFFDGKLLVSAYYVLAMAENASNLAKLDGTMFGPRSEGKNMRSRYSNTRSENFTPETKRRIVGGTQVLAHGYADGIYDKAVLVRKSVEKKFVDDFKTVDIILSPVSPTTPAKLGESMNDPLKMYLSDVYTVGFSLGGLPTLTYPGGTPTGVQISATKCREDIILKFAKYLNNII